jgi:Uma2 family endonuclease
VEVASPGTASLDKGLKLEGYFSLPSVVHYLILDSERRVITHHARDSAIQTGIVRDGEVRLQPPGIAFQAGEAFA